MARTFLLGFLLTIVIGLASATSVHAQERVPVRGATYNGLLTDTTGECSRGNLTIGPGISFLTSEYGSRITGIGLTGLSYSALSFVPESYTIIVNIPVDDSGSFNQDFSQFGVDTQIEGRFEETNLSGSLRASVGGVTECEGTFVAQASVPRRYEGPFSGPIESRDDCGGGTIALTRSADLLSITKMSVEGFRVDGDVVSGSANFAPNTARISDDTGVFDWVYFSATGGMYEIAASGSFPAPWQLNGAVVVSPSSCGMMPFTGIPLPSTGPGLPPVGFGSGPPSRGAGLWLELLLAMGGAILLATGVAISGRRAP